MDKPKEYWINYNFERHVVLDAPPIVDSGYVHVIEKYAYDELKAKLDTINTPEIKDFLSAVENEAKHQRLRWPAESDAGKTNPDWFWLIGYLAGKAIAATKPEKMLHHIVTTAAACLNWHAARMKLTDIKMRPGIASPDLSDGCEDRG